MDKHLKLIATSTFGLESLVKKELIRLGYEITSVENGRIEFLGNEIDVCRTNIWLRCAERIRLVIGEFRATSFEELFENTKALPWEEWLDEKACFPVEGKSVKSQLYSVPDCQAIVKKAIVERLKLKYNNTWFAETGALYKIEVALLKDKVTLTIDCSGSGLHKRGYRKLINEAPLKETLASALIILSGWKADRLLIDPFCGTGTIPIEATLIGKNIAPGINRQFVSESWARLPRELWMEARREAHDLAKYDRELHIMGTDQSEKAIKIARSNAEEAMVSDDVHFQVMDFKQLSSKKKGGFIICNPPYGERLESLDTDELYNLYKDMGIAFSNLDNTWSYGVLTAYEKFETAFNKKSDKNRKLYNGNIKTYYYQYKGERLINK